MKRGKSQNSSQACGSPVKTYRRAYTKSLQKVDRSSALCRHTHIRTASRRGIPRGTVSTVVRRHSSLLVRKLISCCSEIIRQLQFRKKTSFIEKRQSLPGFAFCLSIVFYKIRSCV